MKKIPWGNVVPTIHFLQIYFGKTLHNMFEGRFGKGTGSRNKLELTKASCECIRESKLLFQKDKPTKP